MKLNKKVTAIIPVFNEEKSVARVVKILLASSLINEVVVVNDGSGDKSLEILEEFGTKIKLFSSKKNMGKGWAIAKGVGLALGKIVMFIDADLTNLNNEFIKKLLKPINKPGVKAVVGYLKKSKYLPTPFARLTGERVYYKEDLLPHLKEMRVTRFGLEVFLNHLYKDKNVERVALIKLEGLYKYDKVSAKMAVKEYFTEGLEIARELAKQEKLLPADIKIIEKLRKVTKVVEWKLRVNKIKNQKVRNFLLKYVIKYLR